MQGDDFQFRSFIQAGFESSTHKRLDGKRLDLVESTGHDRWAARDYQQLRLFGIRTVRESARWHLIERERGRYNFASLACLLDAAASSGTEVILDLLHFGWPDFYNPFDEEFPERFAEFTRAGGIGCAGNCAHTGENESGQPLLHGSVSGHAETWIYADVRTNAGPP